MDKNRVTSEEAFGLVVDYYGVSKELEVALASSATEDVRHAMNPLEHDPAPIIKPAVKHAESHFRGKKLDDT